MTNEELYNIILARAGRRNDPTLRLEIENELRQMIQAWERGPFHPWFLERTSSGLVTVVDTMTVDLPEDYLLQVEDTKFWLTNDEEEESEIPLDRAYHEDIESDFKNVDSGQPECYDIFADKIYLGATPDEVYPLSFKYHAKTTAPVDNEDAVSNPWVLNAEDFFVTTAAARLVGNYLNNEKKYTLLRTESVSQRAELHKYNEARKHTNMDYSIDR